MPAPNPDPPPVTIATLSFSRMHGSSVGRLASRRRRDRPVVAGQASYFAHVVVRPVPAQALRHAAGDAGGRIGGRLRGARAAAGQRGRSDPRRLGDRRIAGRAERRSSASTARPLARYADWVGGLLRGETARSISYDTPTAELIAERLRVTLPLALLAMAITTVLALGARRLCRVAPQPAGRRRRDGGQPARHRDSQLLVRDPADPAVRGAPAMGQRRRLSGLDRRRGRRTRRRPGGADPAGDRAGAGAGGDPDARHPLGGARGDARGLRAHRARQGPEPAPGAVAARAAQRDDPGADGGRACSSPT